ncbi:MAG: hypothetical protein WBM00_01380 [Solirubrobacterales bacterium]
MDLLYDIRSPADEDAATELAVLYQLLTLHPVQVTRDELLREMVGETEDFGRRDAVSRAVRDLVGAGLVHLNGNVVFASRAAFRFNELLSG